MSKKKIAIWVSAAALALSLVAYSYVATGQWSHAPTFMDRKNYDADGDNIIDLTATHADVAVVSDATDGYLLTRSGTGWTSTDPSTLGGGDAVSWSPTWPAGSYDWRTEGAGTEPTSGITLTMANGLVTDFTTLTFSSAGLTFDISNSTGGLVRAVFSIKAGNGIPVSAVTRIQMDTDLATLGTAGEIVSMLVHASTSLTTPGDNEIALGWIYTGGAQSQYYSGKAGGISVVFAALAFGNWANPSKLVASRYGKTLEAGVIEGGAYTPNASSTVGPVTTVDSDGGDTNLFFQVYVPNGGAATGVISDIFVEW